MERVDVSVILPCYNVSKYLDEAIATARRNDRARMEIICVNDGSTDDSLSIMERHASLDPRVKVIDKPNQGYGASVNRGIDESHGIYVAILEPDDYVLPHMYDRLFEVALDHGSPDVVKSSFKRVCNAGTPEELILEGPMTDNIFPPHQPFTIVDAPEILRHHPSVWSALYRRSFLDAKGIRFMEVPGAGWVDNPFMVEMYCQADSIVYVNESYYCYREFLPGSSSDIKFSTMPFERWHNMADILERLGVTDDGVWDAIHIRQFDCIVPQVEQGAMEQEPYASAILSVINRMDEERVRRLPVITPYQKELFYRLRGMECPSDARMVFLKGRIVDFARTLKHYGVGAFLRRVKGVVSRGGKVDYDFNS
ncbi:MAG: glycosyltransferase [Atopobiaceae bacterium]|nr:glycosyltransferase [Atopobiaceae bacterium]